MKVSIDEIRIKEGRRSLDADHVRELADSIRELGLLNPITIDSENTLIAGLHRLEAARRLGWKEVECSVSSLDGLQAELAEIDENFVRSGLSAVEYGEMLLRRKEIYEMLHPETKATYDGGAFRGNQHTNGVGDKMSHTSKSFVQDTADKLGVVPRTVERQIQTARNLTAEAKKIIKESETKLSQKAALKLSRLEPEQQKEAAELLAAKEIQNIEEYSSRAGATVDMPHTNMQPESQAYEEKSGFDAGVFPLETEPQEYTSKGIPEQNKMKNLKATPDFENHCLTEQNRLEKQTVSDGLLHGNDICESNIKGHKCLVSGSETVHRQQPETEPVPVHTQFHEPAPELPHQAGRKDKAVPLSACAIPDKEPQGGISLKEIIADLKDPDKDCSGTPESFLQEYDAFVRKFHREIDWYNDPYYDTVYPFLTDGQLTDLRSLTDSIISSVEELFQKVKTASEQKGTE